MPNLIWLILIKILNCLYAVLTNPIFLPIILLLFVLWIFFNFTDLLSTHFCLKEGGKEGNGFVKIIFDRFGFWKGGMALKIYAVLILLILIYGCFNYYNNVFLGLLIYMVGFLIFVLINNIFAYFRIKKYYKKLLKGFENNVIQYFKPFEINHNEIEFDDRVYVAKYSKLRKLKTFLGRITGNTVNP